LSDILVDTNVLVYSFDPGDRKKQTRAREVLALLGVQDRVVLSVQCLTEFFRTVRWGISHPLSPEDALLEVRRLTRACRIFELTSAVVLDACEASNRHQLSIWDALIWAVARANAISLILTEDAEHGRILEGIHYLNPFHPEFELSMLQAGA
jgi:predicted nucleic acid-binding protein